jgi:hypothetical protein
MSRRRLQVVWAFFYNAVFAAVLAVVAAGQVQAQQRKKIVLGEITVEGRRQKPQAFYILQRQNLNFEGLELKKSFVPKIEKSVHRQPF